MVTKYLATATNDISAAIKRSALIRMLGWQDIKQRYRRSALGPFWLTLSMGIMITTMAIVFGQIFNSSMSDFLPFLSIGIIVWGFMTTTMIESCTSFIAAEGIIRQLPIPLFVHVARTIWRNMLIFMHNFVIFPVVLLAMGKSVSLINFLALPGFLLLLVNLAWVSLLLAVVCTRYSDLPQIVTNLLQVAFYLTPIMWLPALLPKRTALYLLDYNPAYHLLELVRAPLLGQPPHIISWGLCGLSAVIGWAVALFVYGRYKNRIAYWL